MSRIEQFSIERAGDPLSEWTDALSTRIGHVPPSSWDERFTTCRTVGEVAFVGRIEMERRRNHRAKSQRELTPSRNGAAEPRCRLSRWC